MHTLGKDTAIGLLLFDEPSAALNPVAKHGPRLRAQHLDLIGDET